VSSKGKEIMWKFVDLGVDVALEKLKELIRQTPHTPHQQSRGNATEEVRPSQVSLHKPPTFQHFENLRKRH
jgi:hypothetical protein